MSRRIVIANWKMNGSATLCERFAEDFVVPEHVEVWFAPPAIHFHHLASTLAGANANVKVGVQNVFYAEHGAFTGEISAAMVKSEGGFFALVGHSERRTMFGDEDEVVADKANACLVAQLMPVICVGETLEEREQGMTEAVVSRQLLAVSNVHGFRQKVVIAYEPVWAIGTGVSASPEQAQAVHAYIRNWLVEEKASEQGEFPVLYGGSVKPSNAKSLIQQPDIDGFLVGGASLDVDDFGRICMITENN